MDIRQLLAGCQKDSDEVVLVKILQNRMSSTDKNVGTMSASAARLLVNDLIVWRQQNCVTRFQVKQAVSTVQKTWLEVLMDTEHERVARMEYDRLVAEHPESYFELLKQSVSETCQAFTPKE